VDANHQGNPIPFSTYNLPKEVFLLEDVSKIDARGQ
jgi:hypothetical protein